MALWSNVDSEAGKPKYLNTADKAATLGITPDETATQKATHAGWVLSNTGTGGRSGRVLNETLVAMGSMTGDNDTVAPNPVITIGTQPVNDSVTSPAAAQYVVVASATRGAALSFQWQVSADSGATFTNVTGATTATLDVEDGDAEYVTGNEFRVIVSAVGATAVTSSEVTLTIA